MKKLLSVMIVSAFILTAAGCDFNVSVGGDKSETTPTTTSTTDTAKDTTSTFANLFNTPKFGYEINYPADWQKQEDVNAYTVMFSNGKASIAIQNLASKAMGGNYASVDDVIKEFKAQLNQAKDAKITDEKPLSYTMQDGTELAGQQFVVEYTIEADNATYKQWQIVIPRADGQVFHAISYTSLLENYDTYLPLAQQIIATLKVLK